MVSAKVHAPVVAVVDVAHGRRHAAFGHHGVGFAEQRLADQADRAPRSPPRWPRSGPRRPHNDDHVVFVSFVVHGFRKS
jgi:hypothetical protein